MTQKKKAHFPAVRLERVIPAPPREVYRAWLDRDLLRRWLAPGGITVKHADVDARVGGRLRIWHAEGPVYDSLLTITLRPAQGNATTLTLLHERLDDLAAAMPHVADKVKLGWGLVLEKLGLTLGAHGRRASF